MPTELPDQKNYAYKITTDPTYNNEELGITPEIQKNLREVHKKLRARQSTPGKCPGLINKLKKLCDKYPHIPQFKNYLSTAYKLAGNSQKAYEINKWTLVEHPDYLYGKINLASEYLEKGIPEKVPEILGGELKIEELYPEREVFHLTEVLAVHKSAVRYFLALDKVEEARERLHEMERLDYGHFDTDQARQVMSTYYVNRAAERLKKEQEFGQTVQSRSYDKSVQTEEKPSFTHSEIEALYVNDLRIDHSVIKKILDLPRETLVQDLEAVLQDGINRFEYFRDKTTREGWNDEENNFLLHALFLLPELNAEDSLPSVLNLLRQGEEFLDFWFSDLLTEMVWEIVYHLGQYKLSELKAFLMEPNLYSYARNTVNKAVSQIALHYPGRMPEIIHWYADLFEFFLDNTDNVRVIDTDLISFMVWNCIDIKAKELTTTIKKLYEHGLVNPYMVGTFEEVKQDIVKPGTGYEKKMIFDIYARYEDILNTWYYDQPQHKDYSSGSQEAGKNYVDFWSNNDASTFGTFERETPKVGRNDPCPCGSGRKYKYCCMN